MKVAVVWSSPNLDGLTAAAKDSFVAGLVSAGAEVEEFHLNAMHIETCRACGDGWGTCHSAGRCFLQDDFQAAYDKLVEADGIVFVTAVYWHDMTEKMKAFVDRLRRCDALTNHSLAEKRCVLVACAGGTGRGTLDCLTTMERALTHMSMRVYDRISVVRYSRDYMIPVLKQAGETYVDRLIHGFDMGY